MKRWERIAALVLAVVGIGAAAKARTMGFGTFHHPGPGFFPFWLSAILALASLIYLSTRLGQDREKLSLWESGSWVRPLIAGTGDHLQRLMGQDRRIQPAGRINHCR